MSSAWGGILRGGLFVGKKFIREKISGLQTSREEVVHKPNFCEKKKWKKMKERVSYTKFSQETENDSCHFVSFVEKKVLDVITFSIKLNSFISNFTYKRP